MRLRRTCQSFGGDVIQCAGGSQFSSVVEQRFCKPSVVGSNPTTGSSFCCLRNKEIQPSERPLSAKMLVKRPRELPFARNRTHTALRPFRANAVMLE